MTTTTKPVPGYLKPTEFEQATAQVVYEPPLAPGTQIRMGEFRTLEERTFRYEHCKTGEPMELVEDPAAVYEIAGTQDLEIWRFNSDAQEFQLQGHTPCHYAVTGEERPYDFEAHLQTVLESEAFRGVCERDQIADPEAYLRAHHRTWMCPSNAWVGRKYFPIGAGAFHSALIGGEWIPVVREVVRTQVRPVLGWALEGAAQTSYKGAEQAAGHRGIARDTKGRLIRESDVERRRWTTTLDVRALAELDRISTETGEHRNEIVERLVLGAAAARQRASYAHRPDEELASEIERACREFGNAWPRTLTGELAKRYGITKQTINGRKKTMLRRLEQEPQQTES